MQNIPSPVPRKNGFPRVVEKLSKDVAFTVEMYTPTYNADE
jgi:hypothetical protein